MRRARSFRSCAAPRPHTTPTRSVAAPTQPGSEWHTATPARLAQASRIRRPARRAAQVESTRHAFRSRHRERAHTTTRSGAAVPRCRPAGRILQPSEPKHSAPEAAALLIGTPDQASKRIGPSWPSAMKSIAPNVGPFVGHTWCAVIAEPMRWNLTHQRIGRISQARTQLARKCARERIFEMRLLGWRPHPFGPLACRHVPVGFDTGVAPVSTSDSPDRSIGRWRPLFPLWHAWQVQLRFFRQELEFVHPWSTARRANARAQVIVLKLASLRGSGITTGLGEAYTDFALRRIARHGRSVLGARRSESALVR